MNIFVIPSKNWVELLGNVVLLITDSFPSELQNNIWICLAVQVHRVQICAFDYVDAHQHVDGVAGWQTLEESVLRVKTHDGVVVHVLGQRPLIHFYVPLKIIKKLYFVIG
jgi:hypothetical protein